MTLVGCLSFDINERCISIEFGKTKIKATIVLYYFWTKVAQLANRQTSDIGKLSRRRSCLVRVPTTNKRDFFNWGILWVFYVLRSPSIMRQFFFPFFVCVCEYCMVQVYSCHIGLRKAGPVCTDHVVRHLTAPSVVTL